jgi:hypothetical protein
MFMLARSNNTLRQYQCTHFDKMVAPHYNYLFCYYEELNKTLQLFYRLGHIMVITYDNMRTNKHLN